MQLRRSTGLVGHWKFNEKSGIIANDSSRYRNTGTLTGATHLPKWGEKGIIFDGVDDYVNCGNAASLNITGAITIEAWIESPQAAVTAYPINKAITGVTDGYEIALLSQKIRWRLNQKTSSNIYSVNSVTTLANNTWYHVVGTYGGNGTNMMLYINGAFEIQVAGPSSIGSNNLSLLFGKESTTYFNGSIDEVRIYNRALSALEISRLYNSTKHKYI